MQFKPQFISQVLRTLSQLQCQKIPTHQGQTFRQHRWFALPHHFRIGHAVFAVRISHEVPQIGVSLLEHYDESFEADGKRSDDVRVATNPGFFENARRRMYIYVYVACGSRGGGAVATQVGTVN